MQDFIIIVNMPLNKKTEITVLMIAMLHESIEKYVVPIWKQLGSISKRISV